MRYPVTIAISLALTGCTVQPVAPVSQGALIDTSGPTVAAQHRGAAYAETHCASCHAIGATGESALPAAPPFRALGVRYPIENLAEAFAEGIYTAHAAMPEFIMSTQENADLILYLKSIQDHSTH